MAFFDRFRKKDRHASENPSPDVERVEPPLPTDVSVPEEPIVQRVEPILQRVEPIVQREDPIVQPERPDSGQPITREPGAGDGGADTSEPGGAAPGKTEKAGFFSRLRSGLSKTRSAITSRIDQMLAGFGKVDEELFEELEEILITSDVGMETSTRIVADLRERVRRDHIADAEGVRQAIREEVAGILATEAGTLQLRTRPSVVVIIGVNGVGKTTSIGKIAHLLKGQGKKVIVAAADTFRAAAIDQLEIWTERAGVPIIKHEEGSDPAAVIFDAIAAVKARNADVLIVDTAGRLHTKKNLMEELRKIFRVIRRELPEADVETLLVLDATTGQNAVSQAKVFSEVGGLTGLVLTKLDGTAKGGIIISIMAELNVPVKFVGVGEQMDDLQVFDPENFVEALFGRS